MSKIILSLICALTVSLGLAQEDSNSHEAYHCAMCAKYLFDSDDAVLLSDNELHYHGIATDHEQSAFHCSGCKNHLGYFSLKDSTYQASIENVGGSSSLGYTCTACQWPLFDSTSLEKKTDEVLIFSRALDANRVKIDTRPKFFKVELPNNELKCRWCDARIGSVQENESGGFGLRIHLGAVKKGGK